MRRLLSSGGSWIKWITCSHFNLALVLIMWHRQLWLSWWLTYTRTWMGELCPCCWTSQHISVPWVMVSFQDMTWRYCFTVVLALHEWVISEGAVGWLLFSILDCGFPQGSIFLPWYLMYAWNYWDSFSGVLESGNTSMWMMPNSVLPFHLTPRKHFLF